MPPENARTPRKRPRQKRSQQTVAAILEASARILVEHGFKKLNTNRVAELAGVSIGSLYQYFPNKEALVLALAEEHLAKQIALLAGLSAELQALPLTEAVREFIRSLIQTTAVDAELHRVFVTEVVHLGEPLVRRLQLQAEQAVLFALQRRREEILPTDLELAAFFLVSAVDSIILRSLTFADERFQLANLEDELHRLIMRYLTGTP